MQKLNLEAKDEAQKRIKAHLEQNATTMLAEKINNGVYITKDGIRLLNKKTLTGFITYATGEARKLAAKGTNSACVDDNVVFGWAMHYFQEDDIIGTLYTEDGTEYKKVITPSAKAATTTTSVVPSKPEKKQTSIFDILTGNGDNQGISGTQSENDEEEDDDTFRDDVTVENEGENKITPNISPNQTKNQGSKLYQDYMRFQHKYPDCILFYRLGDFYEAFGESAVKASKFLDLTLTGRDCGLAERVAMCGIPYHATDSYIKKLADGGYKIAVVENTGNNPTKRVITPKVVFKDGNKIDTETGEIINDEPEELPEDEMKEFDSYVDEDEELITVSKLTEGLDVNSDEDDLLASEREIAKAFNSEAVAILSELFDGEINIA